jgi:hypothetical protein
MCDELPCPEACLCHGLAFVCNAPFQTALFSQLRYLDGAESGMTPKDVASNTYLIHLILAQCGLKEFPETLLPNLQHLDLSFNQLQAVSMDVFLKLKNLVYR